MSHNHGRSVSDDLESSNDKNLITYISVARTSPINSNTNMSSVTACALNNLLSVDNSPSTSGTNTVTTSSSTSVQETYQSVSSDANTVLSSDFNSQTIESAAQAENIVNHSMATSNPVVSSTSADHPNMTSSVVSGGTKETRKRNVASMDSLIPIKRRRVGLSAGSHKLLDLLQNKSGK
jgi:hypothetical protein